MHLAASLLYELFCFYEYAARFATGAIQGLLGTARGGHHIGSMISSYCTTYALTALAAGLPFSLARTALYHFDPRSRPVDGLCWLESRMLKTNSISYHAVRHRPRLRPAGITRSQPDPLWCDVRDTPWVAAMRGQVATAAVVGERLARVWHFYPLDQTCLGRDGDNHE
jgi:hypothetical protein